MNSAGVSRRCIITVVAVLATSGCGRVTMQPLLSPSVSIEALEELGEIRRVPARVGILIDPELRNLTFQLEQRAAIYQLPVGRVIAAKIVKLATYIFNEVSVLKQAPETPMLLMRVTLQGEQPGLTTDVERRGLTIMVDVTAKIDLRIRAALADGSDTVWVGASRVTQEIQSGVLEHGGLHTPDISRPLSEVVDKTTDLLVADLMNQVRRSESLRQYLEARR